MNHRKYCFNLMLFLLLSVISAKGALATCSNGSDGNPAYIGKATLNEYYHSDQSLTPNNYFIETKLLYTSLNQSDYKDWSILICSQRAASGLASECITGNQTVANDNANYPNTEYHSGLVLSGASGNQDWLVLDQSNGYPGGYIDNDSGTGHGMEVTLLDAFGNVIDYTSVSGYTKHAAMLGVNSCKFLFDNAHPGSNTFTVQRLEDGTGCWPQSPAITTDSTINGTPINCLGVTPPSGSSGAPTAETPNLDTSSSGTYPYVSISPIDTTVAIGGSVSFTVSITGALLVTTTKGVTTTTIDTSVITADVDLIIGIATVDGSTTAPTPTVTTVTIPAGSPSATFSINTSLLNPSPLIGDTFYVYVTIDPSTTYPNNANTSGAFVSGGISTVTFIAGAPDHYSISFTGDGLTCEAKQVIVTAHDALHNPITLAADTAITVTTSPAVDAIATSPVTIAAGASSATFYLSEITPTSGININVVDGASVTEASGSAVAADDPPLAFANTALRFVDTTSAAAITIGNQIGSKPSSTAPLAQTIGLQAIRTDTTTGACVAAFPGQSVAINLAYQCNNPLSCGTANRLTLSPTTVYAAASAVPLLRNDTTSPATPISYDHTQPVTLAFDATTGIAPLSFVYDDVGKVTLYATTTLAALSTTNPPTTAATLTGQSNAFVVSPFGFYFDTAAATAAADLADDGLSNGSRTSYAADATGVPFTTAGSDFTLNLKILLWQAADDTNGDGIPDTTADLSNNTIAPNFGHEITAAAVTLGYSLNAPAAGSNGTLTQSPATLTSANFVTGSAAVTYNWSEVGIIDLMADITSYLGGGSVSTTLSGLGRFIPDHFEVTVGNTGAYANSCSSGVTPYTYVGETFGYEALNLPAYTISAWNVHPTTPAVTTNYTGAFAKLDLTEIGLTYPTSDAIKLDQGGVSKITTTTSTAANNANHSITDNANGTLRLTLGGSSNTDTFTYTHGTGMVSPFTANLPITLSAITETTDGIVASGTPFSLTPIGNLSRFGQGYALDGYSTSSQIGTTVTLPIGTQYYDATGGWVTNNDDSCSIFSYIKSDSGITTTATPASAVTVNGGAGNVTLILTADAAPSGGSATVATTFDSWLRSNLDSIDAPLDGDFYDDNPSATATFGNFRGDDRFLYWNEVER